MIRPEDLTTALLRAYYVRHCRCAPPLDLDRSSHDVDCDTDACEDVRVALGGHWRGERYPRSSSEALVEALDAKWRICEAIDAAAAARKG